MDSNDSSGNSGSPYAHDRAAAAAAAGTAKWRTRGLQALFIAGCVTAVYLLYQQEPAGPGVGSERAPVASETIYASSELDAAEPNANQYDGGPIVIELFTSQGCSSCPPADRVLSLLRQTGQIDGIPIVTLSEHVDYWNRLGWTDPYSQAVFSDRQAAYARSINRSNRIYTPQMVVDGREEFVGHNLRRATEAVRRAATRRRIPLELTVAREGSTGTVAKVRVPASAAARTATNGASANSILAGAELIVVVSEDGLDDRVKRGENAGHTLRHDGVVRRLIRTQAPASIGESTTVRLELEPDWRVANLRVVAWLANRESQEIQAAASAGIPTQ
ncbi:MAG: DUF1223 domain-containing protein [bacterium]|nr:DUF1223 domain-containing protein [bacterium]